jgi:GAF domain-containing protein
MRFRRSGYALGEVAQGDITLEPLPETRQALTELAAEDGNEIASTLYTMGARVKEIAPECVGLSLSIVEDGLTFTLMATEDEMAILDAIQYLDGGPCVEAAERETYVEVREINPMDEENWSMFARASAHAGVASSLSLPLLEKGRLVGGVNIYGSTPDAFHGRHEAVATALNASAEGAVADADLQFRTRAQAAEAPHRLEELRHIDIAVGIIAASHRVSTASARERLKQAALRAGISEAQTARAVRNLREL